MFAEIGQIGMFVWKTFTLLPTTIRHYRKQTLKTMNDMAWGSGSIIVDGGVVSLMFFLGIAVGAVVAIMAFMAFDLLGFGALTGIISSFGNIRVVAPIITGIGFAAQAGCRMTAEIGAMRISEEIDALDSMAIWPIPYMVTTRLMASITAIVPLYVVCLGVSYLSTQIIVSIISGGSMGGYLHYFGLMLSGTEIFYSIIKCVIFVAIASVLQCYYGFYAGGGPEGVGVAAGHAMRAAITVVVIVNMLLTMAMFSLSAGARFGG